MDKINVRRDKVLILVTAALVTTVIVSILLIDLSRKAEIEEQKEAIRQVIPGITEKDLDSLMSMQVYAAYGQVGKGQNVQATLNGAEFDLKDQHLYPPDGPISFGYCNLGCIMIFLDEDASEDRETIDEIYQVVDSHASTPGTNTTPVLFIRTPQFQVDMEKT